MPEGWRAGTGDQRAGWPADPRAAWNDANQLPDAKNRQAALVRMPTLMLERVCALPLGALTKEQAVRANVQGVKSFRIPRMSNVSFTN
jgi:peptide/nickel transport system substrate-binding protein